MNLVSTIIPAYNAEAFISKAIESALLQDMPQQIIVVDDGSKDQTAEVVRSFGDAVELIQQPNGGVSAARNRGIAAARGDFVAFLDADDVWLSGKLAAQLALFAADSELGTVICDEVHVTAEGDVVRPSFLGTKQCFAELPTVPARLSKPVTWLVRESFFPTSGVVTRRAVLNRAGAFDTSLSICEDRDLWLRLALAGPVGLVPQVLLRYLTGRTDSLSVLATRVRWAESLRNVLLRYASPIKTTVREEGGQPEALLAEVFDELGSVFWYADRMDLASAAFGDAIRFGSRQNLLRWMAAWTGTASLLRRFKGLVGT